MSSTSEVATGNFRRFWAGQALAQFGRALGGIAMPVLAVQLLAATEAQMGYLNAASTAAFLLVGLPAGAWVDRWFKRRTMIVADVIRFVVTAAIPVLWWLGWLHMWHLYAVALVVGCASVFFDVAYQSYIPFIVGRNEIAPANSRLELTAQVARLSGPSLGGLLLRIISVPVLILADAIGYLASVAFLVAVRDHEADARQAEPVERRGLLREIGEGLGFVVRHPQIRLITASTACSNLTATVVFTLSPLLFLRIIGFDEFTFGLIMTGGGVGGLAVAGLLSWARQRMSTTALIRAGMVVAGIGMLAIPVAMYVQPRPLAAAVAIVGEVLVGAGVVAYNITQVSLRQRLCPPRLLGRMNASIRFAVWGVMPIAALAAGWLCAALGTPTAVWIGAVGGWLALIPLLALRVPADLDDAEES